MKSVLVGNGFNIAFGEKGQFENKDILNRFFNNLRSEECYYKKIMERCLLPNSDFKEFMRLLHEQFLGILRGEYDTYCKDKIDEESLARIKNSYGLRVLPERIGFEDYFFVLRMVECRFPDLHKNCKAAYDGLCIAFLDSIFHGGKIQSIHENIPLKNKRELKHFFSQFDLIFTVNYDWNIEKIAQRKVCYLHGNFHTLLGQYNPETVWGQVCKSLGLNDKSDEFIEKNKHLFCNAIMAFSGPEKQKMRDAFKFGESQNEFINALRKGSISFDNIKEIGRKAPKDSDIAFALKFMEILGNDILKIPDNPYKESIDDVSGELHIVGMSPNNDDHIWNAIEENKKIEKVVFYYRKGSRTKDVVQSLYGNRINLEFRTTDELWGPQKND